jgi:uncharacterized membrane protein
VGLALLALLVAGALLRGWEGRVGVREAVSPLLPAGLLLGAGVLVDDVRLLLAFPVLVNLLLLLGFGATLRSGRVSAVERFARMQEEELPDGAVAYCRSVTKVWCVFFVLNGAAAGAFALWAPVSWWAAYTGAVAYVLMGLVFGVEYVVRKARFRRYGRGLQDRFLSLFFPPRIEAR